MPSKTFRVVLYPNGSVKLYKKGRRGYMTILPDELEDLIGILEDAGDPHRLAEEPRTPLHQKKPEPGPDSSWRLQCFARVKGKRRSRGTYYFSTEHAAEVFRRTIKEDVTESVLSKRGPWKSVFLTMDVRLHEPPED